ncbi:hypothetical protein I552_8042 [Mycobacterium xenopi 3993]|nr:hypothetical protein I552_8042 [Mycobacterium xenopi 3993]
MRVRRYIAARMKSGDEAGIADVREHATDARPEVRPARWGKSGG